MSKALDLIARLKKQVETGNLGAASQADGAPRLVKTELDSEGQLHYAWDKQTERLAKWLETWSPPVEPFAFQAEENGRVVVTVTRPATFRSSLLADVAAGPSGTRSRTGALQSDLARLYELFGGI